MTDEHVKAAVKAMQSRMDEMVLGPSTSYAEPQGPPLTYERLMETVSRIPKAPPPMRFLEVPLYAVKVQAKRHPRKKRRLQKKWLARYGYRTEYRRHFQPGQMLVDEKHGVVYAHAEEVEAMQRRLKWSEGL